MQEIGRGAKVFDAAAVRGRFLRPFAEIAGVADDLDWTVPRDVPEPLYQNASIPDDGPYYDLYDEASA